MPKKILGIASRSELWPSIKSDGVEVEIEDLVVEVEGKGMVPGGKQKGSVVAGSFGFAAEAFGSAATSGFDFGFAAYTFVAGEWECLAFRLASHLACRVASFQVASSHLGSKTD